MTVASFRQWHKMLGLTLGILLFLVALSGGVLVFKDNLVALNLPESSTAPDYDIDHLSRGLSGILSRHPAGEIFYIKTPTQGRAYWWVALHGGDILLFDGATGVPIEDRWNILPLLHWLTDFHTELLMPATGTTWVTLLGIGTLVLMAAGFVSWWPGRKGFRLWHLWLWPKRRGPALRQHRAVAILSLPLLLVSVVTGGGMSVQSALQYWLSPEKEEAIVEEPGQVLSPATNPASLNGYLKAAQDALPEGQITMLGVPGENNPFLRLRFRFPGEWHINGKTSVTVNVSDGSMDFQRIESASTGRRILNAFYPLHSSFGLSGYYQAAVALTAVLTAMLALLGLFAWLKRRGSATK